MSVLLAPWVKYFEGINKLLGTQQAAATQHFGLFQSVASPDPGARAVLDRMQLTDLVVVLLRHDGRPVSHFDELNTYALLDLISGLQTRRKATSSL
jgi:hypothetical protein